MDPGYGVPAPGRDCYKCPPPRNYDSQEVVKQSRDIDHSRVIETQSVIQSKRLIETNHLIIHENETRNIGTVQHNHTIIEKELVLAKRNVDNKYINTVVNLVEHKYNTQRQHVVEERELPGENRDLRECNCDHPSQLPIRAYGMANANDAYGFAPRNAKTRQPRYPKRGSLDRSVWETHGAVVVLSYDQVNLRHGMRLDAISSRIEVALGCGRHSELKRPVTPPHFPKASFWRHPCRPSPKLQWSPIRTSGLDYSPALDLERHQPCK